MCSSSQPLATAIGCKILSAGGTAADAAVAMAAALNVTEPCSTGIGGDAFAMFYDAKTKKVSCLQGNGATSKNFTLDLLKERGYGIGEGLKERMDLHSGLCVPVPGAAALWDDLVKNHGKLSLKEVLEPAICLAREGFPVSPVCAYQWSLEFIQGEEAERVLHPGGRSPAAGEIFRNPDLACTFEELAARGAKEGFYKGRIADAIVEAVAEYGGVLCLEDLATHETAFEDPISAVFRHVRIYEPPPPTQGLAALLALRLIEKVSPPPLSKMSQDSDSLSAHSSASQSFTSMDSELRQQQEREYLRMKRGSAEEAHISLECMRLAFADVLQHSCDPRHRDVPVDSLLSDEYINNRAKVFKSSSSVDNIDAGDPSIFQYSDTVYFCCIDAEGNGCSMINSNYLGFGSGIVPKNTGFALHNRAHNFSLPPDHPNVAAPRKRSYHTIIPGLATRESDGSLYSVFGNMGAFMQPMGHVQLIRNLVDFQLNPQAAVDAPKWYIGNIGGKQDARDVKLSIVRLEDGYGDSNDGGGSDGGRRTTGDVVESLKRLGHGLFEPCAPAQGHRLDDPVVRGNARFVYGRGQIITRNPNTGVLVGGSDPRADGCAMPVV